ncbi:serine/threonine-protein kinase UCN-like [Cynara cardunculus var. scolymus]|uniref:non-specific serine/threonine protein kinase n=1 Tax=Cynara cardunculus var. scolymus TaxID=59895 RepID=A0A103YI18_CYNCS|nr:serine/threonine-protein kinase UCN-like [Cynara cardunculus var. scolymus]KVI09443.1 Protein kinase, ATP binding site-containing protein [Cynara cardunculus var. scolymus]
MEATPLQDLHLHNLRAIKVLGNGAMGTVFLVHNLISNPSARSPFALKVVEKSCLQSDRRALWEISVLNRLNHKPHPFLPFLIGFLETHEFLAWAIPFCPGRDLNVLRNRQTDHVFSASAIRFYLAEIICALQHLHTMGIVYRDLKPENVLIQQSGHVTLTDFDLSRTLTAKSLQSLLILSPEEPKKHKRNLGRLFWVVVSDQNRAGITKTKSARVSPVTRRKTSFADGERSNSFVGTEEYLSPEMVRGDGHEFAIDWWALGILAYEMLYGSTPFRGKNRKDTFERILMMQPKFTGKPTPLTDLISKLLEKQPTRRLGYRLGASEVKEHPFFLGLRWELLTGVVRTPFIPSVELTTKTNGINIKEYLQKQREPPSPLDSPSCSISLTEF